MNLAFFFGRSSSSTEPEVMGTTGISSGVVSREEITHLMPFGRRNFRVDGEDNIFRVRGGTLVAPDCRYSEPFNCRTERVHEGQDILFPCLLAACRPFPFPFPFPSVFPYPSLSLEM